jgi:hypothetical protein
LAPIIDPIRELAERSPSQEEFIAGLPGILETMDETELTRRLAVELFKSRGVGDTMD